MPNTSEKTSNEQTFCATPKVSIVMPCYNMANFIRDSLDSLTRQTLQDYELLCVDDGSTDETPAIIREYADKDTGPGRLVSGGFHSPEDVCGGGGERRGHLRRRVV